MTGDIVGLPSGCIQHDNAEIFAGGFKECEHCAIRRPDHIGRRAEASVDYDLFVPIHDVESIWLGIGWRIHEGESAERCEDSL